MPNEDHVSQVETRQQFRQIVGIMIHIIAVPGLTGAAMAAPIMRDAAETTFGEKKHLVFESVRAERPTMAKYDGPTGPPILVVNLGAISSGEAAHIRRALRYPFFRSLSFREPGPCSVDCGGRDPALRVQPQRRRLGQRSHRDGDLRFKDALSFS